MTIKSARQSAGLTQKQLADQTGINIRQIQKIEAGDIKLSNLTAVNYLRLCRALDLDPWQILSE
jgi:transcriptional regulator with XRE-family HTH domain